MFSIISLRFWQGVWRKVSNTRELKDPCAKQEQNYFFFLAASCFWNVLIISWLLYFWQIYYFVPVNINVMFSTNSLRFWQGVWRKVSKTRELKDPYAKQEQNYFFFGSQLFLECIDRFLTPLLLTTSKKSFKYKGTKRSLC